MDEVTAYYDALAAAYDQDRFGNSYGRYLHRQEARIIGPLLEPLQGQPVLSLGCGTGRFMEWATHGLDSSPQMVAAARAKFPDRTFAVGDAAETPFQAGTFAAIYCLHVFMHLPEAKARAILAEAHRLLRPGGRLIFDVPSAPRRRLTRYRARGWHGATAYDTATLGQMAAGQWRQEARSGLKLLPVHRLPVRLRPILTGLDSLLGHRLLRRYASYWLLSWQKR